MRALAQMREDETLTSREDETCRLMTRHLVSVPGGSPRYILFRAASHAGRSRVRYFARREGPPAIPSS